jgi:3-hydroxyisobutyrate dehydrogenase-like beta-hydroxyacid dehydrogenase
MSDQVIGVLHPGEMGAAIGRELIRGGRDVVWCAHGRSKATVSRAAAGRMRNAGSIAELVDVSDVIISVCPPHAATDVAAGVAEHGFAGIYVDANAVAVDTVRRIAALLQARGDVAFVDGGLVGPPPDRPGTTRLYLSGERSEPVAELFEGTFVECRLLDGGIGRASALKMAYAAWTKGTAALILTIGAFALAEGIDVALGAEWATSLPDLDGRLRRAASAATSKGWRWSNEMEQIATSFAAHGLPEGFGSAAADVYARIPRGTGGDGVVDVDAVLEQLLRSG